MIRFMGVASRQNARGCVVCRRCLGGEGSFHDFGPVCNLPTRSGQITHGNDLGAEVIDSRRPVGTMVQTAAASRHESFDPRVLRLRPIPELVLTAGYSAAAGS